MTLERMLSNRLKLGHYYNFGESNVKITEALRKGTKLERQWDYDHLKTYLTRGMPSVFWHPVEVTRIT